MTFLFKKYILIKQALNSIACFSRTFTAIIIFCVALVIIGIKLQVRLAEAFDEGKGFAVGLIFLPIIFLAILAFGKCQYQGEYVE